MKKLFMMLSCALLLGLAQTCLAGARGYNVVLVDISAAELQDAKTLLLPVREARRIDGRPECFSCGVGDRGIAVLYIRKIPAAFSVATLRQVVQGNRDSREKIKQALRDYRDDLIGNGFDGLYIYERTAQGVTLYGLGPEKGGKLQTVQHSGPLSAAQLDQLLERASKAFEAAFVP